MPKNPFEIFGLTPDLVGDLSEKELFGVLKAMYRALLKSVHPDVSGGGTPKGDKAVELNLAFEALNLDRNPGSFRRFRQGFVSRRPRNAYKKALDLEKEILRLKAGEDRLAEAYLDRLFFEVDWAAPAPEEYPAGTVPFPLRQVRLGLLDVAINQNLKLAPWTLGSNYKQMEFDAKGRMSLKPVGRNRFTKIGFIHLLGSVPVEAVELRPLLERLPARFFKNPVLNARTGDSSPSFSVLNRISREKFKNHALAFLRPLVTERAYLFSLNRPEYEETGAISLEGVIIKVEKLG